MNYLGHALLSFNMPPILLGNMIGDFVKGGQASLSVYPVAVQKGLMLHRHIDTFTDTHEAILQAKKLFRPEYNLYSGAVVDTLMDHFIANDKELFYQEMDLQVFANEVYLALGQQQEFFPNKFIPYYQSMLQHNWLFNYRSEMGIKKSLGGLQRKARNMPDTQKAFEIFSDNKLSLEKLYKQFINDIIPFVKSELSV